MAWTYEQKFNGLNNGDLVGQDSWASVSGDSFQVTGTGTLYEGTKYARIISDGVNKRTVTEVTSGTIYVSLKLVTPNNGYTRFYLYNGATFITYIQYTPTVIRVRDGSSTQILLDPAVSDTWYRAGIEFDASTDQARFNLDDGTWTSWYDFAVATTGIDNIQIATLSGNDEYASYDFISPNYSAVTPYEDDWSSSEEMTIDNTKVSGSADLTDFPVLIKDGNLADDVYSGVTMGSGKPKDLRFSTDSDGATKLNFEVVSFDATNKESEIWVKIPTVDYNDDTTIYAWYGNSSASYPDADDADEGSEGVWNGGYKAVWHLNNDPIGTIYDSTSNSNDGTSFGSMTSGDLVDAKIGKGIEFDGSNDGIDMGNGASINALTEKTLSCWIKATNWTSSDYPYLIAQRDAGGSVWTLNGTNSSNDFAIFNPGSTTAIAKINPEPSSGSFHYISASINSSNVPNMYIDGSEVSYAAQTTGASLRTDSAIHIILGNKGGGDREYQGIIEEVRITNTTLSEDWHATEYNNQNEPSTFWKSASPTANTTNFFQLLT